LLAYAFIINSVSEDPVLYIPLSLVAVIYFLCRFSVTPQQGISPEGQPHFGLDEFKNSRTMWWCGCWHWQ